MEIWEDIQGYNSYQVSNYGKVRSTKYKQPRILRPGDIGSGYQQVTLMLNGKPHKMLVHRLVALAFIPNPNNLPFIDHIDRNPLNNRVDNLRWVTNRMNLQNRRDNREGLTMSKYTGVSFRRRDGKWIARIHIEAKNRFLGSFKTEEEAALAYHNAFTQLACNL